MTDSFTAIDFETAQGKRWSICQVGLVRVENEIITAQLSILVQPPNNYYWNNFIDIHGITPEQTINVPTFDKIWHQIEPFITNQNVVAHNGFAFDFHCLKQTLEYYDMPTPEFKGHCTYKIFGDNLASLCKEYKIPLTHHNALSDAKACAELFKMYIVRKTKIMETKENKLTLEHLFINKKLRVPSYQRAYAWEEQQLNQFISDMLEILEKGEYYYGHFIIEDTKEGYYDIIDGQQRITTFILFLIVCRLFGNNSLNHCIDNFKTVDYDQDAFEIIKSKIDKMEIEWKIEDFDLKDKNTLSIQKMLDALNYFRKLFTDKKLELTEIDKYIKSLSEANISIHITTSKAIAVQIFELQNTRGLKLNLIEKVKAKLMKEIYLNAKPDEIDNKISIIQKEFARIYQLEEQANSSAFRGELLLEEILLHHLRIVDDGFKLNENDKNLFNSPSKSGNREESILNYINERINNKSKQEVVDYITNLSNKFKLSVELISIELPKHDTTNRLIGDVLILDKVLSLEFFILIFHLNKKDLFQDIELILKWEKLLFMRDFHDKYYRTWYRDDFEGLFLSILKDEIKTVLDKCLIKGFRSNIGNLSETVKNYIENNKSNILNNAFNWWNGKMVYTLYKYEIAQNADLIMLRNIMRKGKSVEHILPQSWEWSWVEENDDKNISNEGKELQKQIDSIINGIGNLLLITGNENSSKGNKHPKDKYYLACTGGSYFQHNNNRNKWENYKEWTNQINSRGLLVFNFLKEFVV